MHRALILLAAASSLSGGAPDCCPGPLEAPSPPTTWRPASAEMARGTPGPCSEDGSSLDILIIFTPQAHAAAGGDAAMDTLAGNAIADLNTAFAASGVPTVAHLVGVEPVSYNDSGSSSADLSNLQQGAGALGEAQALRDATMADLVCLFVGASDVCGRAYLAVWPGAIGREDLGFSIVSVACAGSPNYTFVHEIGHNLGIRHNYDAAPCSDGARSYARAYAAPDESFSTVVASSGGPPVLMFSSPDLLVEGQPAGAPVGSPQEADASRALLDATVAVSRFRNYDQNNNGICDADEITMGLVPDCDANGVPDEVDTDFNRNGIPDACDISSGASLDADLDGVPDEVEAAVIYVDAGAVGDTTGLDWARAKTDLQDALALAAASGDVQEIWLASGRYTPGPAGARSVYFRPQRGVTIRGGFSGTEETPDQRDPQAPPTVLSGDLAGDDTPGLGNRSDNAYHVLNLRDTSERVELDRLTISGGHADIEVNCSSEFTGGGLFALHSDVLIRDCIFTDNAAYSGAGAGIQDGTKARIVNSDFVANRSINSPVWTSIGVQPGTGSTPAIHLSGDQSGEDNLLLNCRITDNITDGGVSGVFAIGGQPTIANCLFARNVGHGPYGSSALRVQLADGTRVINCTITDNHAPNSTHAAAAGIELFRTEAEVSNTLIWGNTDAGPVDETTQLHLNTGSVVLSINHSSVQGWTGLLGGEGNNADDPAFLDAGSGDYRLDASSPAIDSGNNASLPTDALDLDADADLNEPLSLDLAGSARRVDDPAPDTGLGEGPIVDRGAYERSPAGCNGADLASPYGVLDFTDIVAFLGAFGAMDPLADLAAPDGVFDFTDVVAFLGAYGAGCPG
ncbi:MAG: GC-type dockerin domain-anchored protein [Phycisphaerales bacterium JB059]